MTATLTIYRTRSVRRSQRWAWRLTAGNGRIVATSGEGYTRKDEAERMARLVVSGSYRTALDH